MGQPAVVLKVSGTKRQSQGPVPRPGGTGISPEQFWTEFWTERLEALKRHIESTQASSSETAPGGGPDAENGG